VADNKLVEAYAHYNDEFYTGVWEGVKGMGEASG